MDSSMTSMDSESVVGGGVEGGSSGSGVTLKKGPWTSAEDAILVAYVSKHGEGNWNSVQKHSGLFRCGKSCRLRWANHLRPNLKKGAFTPDEERLIIELHAKLGNKWARMAAQLQGRTDNEIKNYWNTRIKRRLRAGLPVYPSDVQQANCNAASGSQDYMFDHDAITTNNTNSSNGNDSSECCDAASSSPKFFSIATMGMDCSNNSSDFDMDVCSSSPVIIRGRASSSLKRHRHHQPLFIFNSESPTFLETEFSISPPSPPYAARDLFFHKQQEESDNREKPSMLLEAFLQEARMIDCDGERQIVCDDDQEQQLLMLNNTCSRASMDAVPVHLKDYRNRPMPTTPPAVIAAAVAPASANAEEIDLSENGASAGGYSDDEISTLLDFARPEMMPMLPEWNAQSSAATSIDNLLPYISLSSESAVCSDAFEAAMISAPASADDVDQNLGMMMSGGGCLWELGSSAAAAAAAAAIGWSSMPGTTQLPDVDAYKPLVSVSRQMNDPCPIY